MYLFDISPTHPLFGTRQLLPLEEQIADLERQGLLVSVNFRATQAFKVWESEDEGPHYFLELEIGNVLYLNGQYLYDYEYEDEPSEDDAKDSGEDFPAGRFPCTNFTVRRHRNENYVLDIICQGAPLPMEDVELSPEKANQFWKTVPEDGGILTETSFGSLRESLP